MGVNKKIVASTIAMAVATSAVAVYPLSTKGIAEQAGLVNVASANGTDIDIDLTIKEQQFLERIRAIYSYIDTDDLADIAQLYFESTDLSREEYKALVSPLWDVIKAQVESNGFNEDDLVIVADAFASLYKSPTPEQLEALKNNEELKGALVRLLEAFWKKNGKTIETLTPSDLIDTALAIETEMLNQVKSGNVSRLIDSTERKKVIADTITTMMNASTPDKIIEILSGLGVTADALNATLDNFYTSPKLPHFTSAQNALVTAYVRSGTTASAVTSSKGRTHTYSLKVFDISVPNTVVKWSKVSKGDSISITEGGVATLSSAVTTGTATIQASIEGKVVLEKDITMTYTGSSTGGGDNNGGGSDGNNNGGGNSDGQTDNNNGGSGNQSVDDLLNAIGNATGAEKDALIKNAVNAAAKEIEKLSKLDLSKNVTVENGKAVVKVDAAQLSEMFSKIGDMVKALEKAAPGASDKLPKLVVTLDLGSVDAKDVNVGLSSDLMKQALENGVDGIKLAYGGFSATLPVGGSFTGDIDFGSKTSEASSEQTNGKQAASEVYDFSLNVGGQPVTSFDQPIEISIPVKDADGVDKELLTVAKIVDGKLLIQGGKLANGGIVESRTSFSPYVVVENSVTFTDIDSVKSWAGRQIQVMAAKGAIEGRAAGVFAPKEQVTRAEFAKMLIHALELEGGKAAQNFSDVKGTEWFAPYVNYAVNKGIIKGRSATTFAPNAPITRAEMAVMVTRALEAKGVDVSADASKELGSYKDAGQVHSTLQSGVAFAVSTGLMIGDKGSLSPNTSATRAEAAVMIFRAFNYAE